MQLSADQGSTAPAAQLVEGRVFPRWSVVGQFLPMPSAGLLAPGRQVLVGPPLSPSAPNAASAKVVVGVHLVSAVEQTA